MSKGVDSFAGRLEAACSARKVPFSPAAVGRLVDANRQTAATWINGSLPRADVLYRLADALQVDSRWLATGDGEMVPQPVSSDLQPPEADLLARYRGADPRWQLSIRLLSYVATEEQKEIAGDVNVILARVFKKSPRDIKYVSSRRVAQAYGEAPHVAAAKHELRRVTESAPASSSGQTGKRKVK